MPANTENSAMATELEKAHFLSNPKEKQCKECSNCWAIALISRASKVILNILQARLQQYMNLQMFKLDLEKKEEPENKLPTSFGSLKKQENSRKKKIYFCFIDYSKVFDYVGHNKLWKIFQEMGIPDHLTAFWEICVQVKKQQLELDMEQQIGSKLGKK